MKQILAVSVAALLLVGTLSAQDKAKAESPFYGNTVCPVMEKPAKPKYRVNHEGQAIYVCCRKCIRAVRKDAEKFLKKAYPTDKVKKVGNKTCPVMGKKLGKKPTMVTWQGHEVGLCCKKCAKKFAEEPNKYLTLALNPNLKVLGNKICPVMTDEEIVPDSFFVYKGQIINLCCDTCVQDAVDDPEKVMKTLKDLKK